MIATCHCRHCNGAIEFDPEEYAVGTVQTCPRCGNNAKLYIPASRAVGFKPRTEMIGDVPQNIVLLIYLASVILPFVGFFGGVYLMAKKLAGHGVCAIATSILCGIVWSVILF